MNEDYMTIKNLEELIYNYGRYVTDTYNIDIMKEPLIDLKKIIYFYMNKINNSENSKDLLLPDLNAITLKMVRDHIYDKYSNLFPSKDELNVLHKELHRENEFKKDNKENHEMMRIGTDLRDIIVERENTLPNKKDLTAEFEKINSVRIFETSTNEKTKENIDFKLKVDGYIDPNEFDNKMKEIERIRNRDADIIRKNAIKSQLSKLNENRIPPPLTIKQLKDNDELKNMDLNKLKPNLKNDKLLFTEEPYNNNNNNLNRDIQNTEQLNNAGNAGLDFSIFNDDSDDEDFNVSITSINKKPTIHLTNTDTDKTTRIEKLDKPISGKDIIILRTQKIILNSMFRDNKKYPSPYDYKIHLKNPINNITRITLSNILINTPRYKGRGHMSYILLKINDYEVITSNDNNIHNSFAIIYPSQITGEPIYKTYGDDQYIFSPKLDKLDEINIRLCNYKGHIIRYSEENDNLIQEHLIELLIDYY